MHQQTKSQIQSDSSKYGGDTDSSHKNSRSRGQPVLTRHPCRWIGSRHPCSQPLPQIDSNEVTTSTF
ncbi:unnamed protein product [Cuscuta campestris]|uniref:Uncharacterized protein n=1 Tax=Cuscuta campestris TaxID=132261 RepID=A0A484LXN1_9ASTE|nr:unnamed protein product [Cuscuta campestris]